MKPFSRAMMAILVLILFTFCGCQGLIPHDTQSLLMPKLHRSEIVGIVAGFGTTFAGVCLTWWRCSSAGRARA